MNKLTETISRFFQGTAVTIGLGMLVFGGYAFATPLPTEADTYQPPAIADLTTLPSNPACAVHLVSAEEAEIYLTVSGVIDGVLGYLRCMIFDAATCNGWQNTACFIGATVIMAAIVALPGWGALTIFVKRLSGQALKQAIPRIKQMLQKIPDLVIKKNWINRWIPKQYKRYELQNDVRIPMNRLAYFLGGALAVKVIDFIISVPWSQAFSACRCAICTERADDF